VTLISTVKRFKLSMSSIARFGETSCSTFPFGRNKSSPQAIFG